MWARPDPAQEKHLSNARIAALPTNFGLGWKSLPGTSTLAYRTRSFVTKKIRCCEHCPIIYGGATLLTNIRLGIKKSFINIIGSIVYARTRLWLESFTLSSFCFYLMRLSNYLLTNIRLRIKKSFINIIGSIVYARTHLWLERFTLSSFCFYLMRLSNYLLTNIRLGIKKVLLTLLEVSFMQERTFD
jgi:hypothetical protein